MNNRLEILTLCAILCYLGLAAMGPIVSNDVFWHLKMGGDWVKDGLSPFVDHYSFTFAGHDIRHVPWLFQVAVYGFVSLFGESLGVWLIRGSFFGFYALWFYLFLKRRHASTLIIVFGLIWIGLALPLRSHVRPEIVSLFFAPLIMSLSLRCRDRLEGRDFLALFALQWVWINVHASAMFGVVIIGALLIDRLVHFGISEKDYRMATRMVGLGLTLLALTFLNRDFDSVLVDQLLKGVPGTELILEYDPVDYVDQDAFFRVYWVIALVGLLVSLTKRSWMTAIIVLVFGFQAWQSRRYGVPFVYITMPLLLVEAIRYRLSPRASIRNFAFLCTVGATLWCARELVSAKNVFLLAGTSHADRFPVTLVERMKEEQLYGHTLADYNIGGYVLYRLAPDVKVFIDGRTNILYPFGFFESYYQARYRLRQFNRLHDLFRIDQILTVSDWYTGSRLIQTAIRSRQYRIAYDDGRFSLLRRGKGHFAFSSDLHADSRCWPQRKNGEIGIELGLAEKRQLPERSKVLGLLKFAQVLEHAADIGAVLEQPQAWWGDHPSVLRLAVYLATVNGLFDQSLAYFGPLLDWNDAHDRLYLVHSLIRLEKYEMASAYFDEIGSRLPAEPKDLLEMYYALGMELSELNRLSDADTAFLEGLKNDHDLVGHAGFLDVIERVPEFCRRRVAPL